MLPSSARIIPFPLPLTKPSTIKHNSAEHEPPLDPIDTLSDWLGGTMQQAGLGGTRSQRLKEVTIHAGRVNAIVIHAGGRASLVLCYRRPLLSCFVKAEH